MAGRAPPHSHPRPPPKCSLPTWLGGHRPCASAPLELDLLIAQGSFQMKEKAQPHTHGAVSTLCDEWSLCHSVKMNISLR